MSIPDFSRKITAQRPYEHKRQDLDVGVESDRGRIINSAAIRRLQQKTQVFPLERNAAVRSRLTHSLEVQQVGRFINQKITKELRYRRCEDYGFLKLEREIESLVEMSCLMHDIGNPPFGHFGEKAIHDWFATHLGHIFPPLQSSNDDEHLANLQKHMVTDLMHFEGNAQAIRLVSNLLQLNITYTQAAGVFKYTRPAYALKSQSPKDKSYLMKKPGFYLSEQDYVTNMQQALEMQMGCRHPLSYIMEAADDISYCYADIEDAVEKNILSVEKLLGLLKNAYVTLGGDLAKHEFELFGRAYSFEQLLDQAKEKYDQKTIDSNNRFFVELRVKLNHILTSHAVKRFVDNIETIYHGTFNQALLEDDSAAHKLTETFKTVALAHVFSDKEVELQELRGYRIIHGLLDYYQPLLVLNAEQFQGLLAKERQFVQSLALECRMANKLPGKHCRAYLQALNGTKMRDLEPHGSEYKLWEHYYRCRLIQDFISGMTDQFALDEYRSLTVSE